MSVRIFISCVSNEFLAYRDQLRSDLTRHNVEVKVQEDFKELGLVTLEKLDIYISNCDAVIHLVGDMTGAMAGPESTRAILAKYPDIVTRFPQLNEALAREISYTEWEAWLALWHGKPLVIAQADEAAPRGPAYASTGMMRAAQQAHLERLHAVEHDHGTFANADQLARFIFSSPILDLLAKEQSKAKARGAGVPSFALAVVLLVPLAAPTVADQWAKTLGVPIAAPLALLAAVAGVVLPLLFSRYFIMLGASGEPAGSRDREGYDALRESLASGGVATRLYARWLGAFLKRVDDFFGDADAADRTLFPLAFGLRTRAPLWTAPAFDRCLLVALVYPIATIFIMWAVSGNVGPAEEVLRLKPSVSGWGRGAAVVALGFTVFASWRFAHASGWSNAIWAGAVTGAVTVAVAVAIAGKVAGVVAVTVAVALAFTGTGALAVAVAAALAVAVSAAGAFAGAGALAVAAAGALALAVVLAVDVDVAWLGDHAVRTQRQGLLLLLFSAAMMAGCLVAAQSLASLPLWRVLGPLLLFLVLLTLLNAPFDWVSLGLTRALLRRGLELKGWWPFFLATADALAAILIVALLALTMVIGVQTFDALAARGGGNPVLPLTILDGFYDYSRLAPPLLDGIAHDPAAPEFWWVYALLLSTMIPSLINLAIGGTALMRAVPGLASALLRFLPAAGGVPAHDRAWIAAVLTLQAALGAVAGVVVQALAAWGLVFYAMPAMGLGLLDLARGLAAFDLPARSIALFVGL